MRILAYLINEQSLIQDSMFQFENRLDSKLIRFLDKMPTFVTYYHINADESTTDEGYRDIESIVGHRSPLKYNKIENFPLYGIESVVLNLQDTEQGLDTEYSSEAVILPNTLKPLHNDIFVIRTEKGAFLFRVDEVQTDSIRPDNFYQIRFFFQCMGEEWIEKIEKYQLFNSYTCLLENIGTDNTCIILDGDYDQINGLNSMIREMIQAYYALFYSERYNCFLGILPDGRKLFDPLQSVFINKNRILQRMNDYKTIILSEGFDDRYRKIKYERSIYRFFERKNIDLINEFPYHVFPGDFKEDSIFHRWYDKYVHIIDIPAHTVIKCPYQFLPERIVNTLKLNSPSDSEYVTVMQKYLRDESMSIYDVPLTLHEEVISLNDSMEVYLFTPILIYIVQRVLASFS